MQKLACFLPSPAYCILPSPRIPQGLPPLGVFARAALKADRRGAKLACRAEAPSSSGSSDDELLQLLRSRRPGGLRLQPGSSALIQGASPAPQLHASLLLAPCLSVGTPCPCSATCLAALSLASAQPLCVTLRCPCVLLYACRGLQQAWRCVPGGHRPWRPWAADAARAAPPADSRRGPV